MHYRSVPILVLFAALLPAVAACRTTSIMSLVGNQAQYSPARRGYVVSTLANPGDGILLVDPIRQRKIRCREELEPWVRAWSEALPQNVSDSAWDTNSYGYMFPFTTVVVVGAIGASIILVVPYAMTRIPYAAASSRSSTRLFDDAMYGFRAARYQDTANLLEDVLVKGDLDPVRAQYLYYYLGLSYEQLKKDDLAAATLARFVETSPAFDQAAYDVAEARLPALQGHGLPTCRSQEPITLPWKE
jgi:hypothetical protein